MEIRFESVEGRGTTFTEITLAHEPRFGDTQFTHPTKMRLLWAFAGLVLIATRIVGAVIVPNVSFEESSGDGPAGWTFIGSPNASPGAWTSDQPFSGKRALRIDAHYGSQQWE